MDKKSKILEELSYAVCVESRMIIEPEIWRKYQELTEQFKEAESESPEETHLLNRLEQMEMQYGSELDEYLTWADYLQDKCKDILGDNNNELISELEQCDNVYQFLKDHID